MILFYSLSLINLIVDLIYKFSFIVKYVRVGENTIYPVFSTVHVPGMYSGLEWTYPHW